MLRLRNLCNFWKINSIRHLSASSSPCDRVVAEPLEQRALLRVCGTEAYGFLQGLMTNDIAHVETGISSMYTMFLNTRGRVLYDAIIYRTAQLEVLFIECDASATSSLERHLKMYRLRKKVTIDPDVEHKVWAVYNPQIKENPSSENLVDDMKDKLLGQVLPCEELELRKRDPKDGFSFSAISSQSNILLFRDPRINDLGLRVLCPRDEDINKTLNLDKGSTYRALRYTLGVGEGVEDLPPDNCFPLEANCDYLHGVSFHKGCYIGQELTARTYHTGIIRKRLMPIMFEAPVNVANVAKQQVMNEVEKPVGKIRGIEGLRALGLLRVSEVLAAKSLSLGSLKVQTNRPKWWPQLAPKELESRDKQ